MHVTVEFSYVEGASDVSWAAQYRYALFTSVDSFFFRVNRRREFDIGAIKACVPCPLFDFVIRLGCLLLGRHVEV